MDNGNKHLTTEQAWRTWRAACAVDLCPPSDAVVLRAFGAQRFRFYLDRYASRTGHRPREGQTLRVSEDKDAWHFLETHAQAGATREGKRYKDWLFARAEQGTDTETGTDTWLRAVESGASLLMRDAVREYLRREHAAAFMESLQRPASRGDDTAYTLEELIPDQVDPLGIVEAREWNELGRATAESYLATMTARERIALWARANSIALSDPDLTRWAACGKSALHDAYTQCVKRLCAEIKRSYAAESPAIWVQLARVTLERLNGLLFQKIMAEKGAARFFKKKGIRPNAGPSEHEMART